MSTTELPLDESDLRGLDQAILLVETAGWNVPPETGKRLRRLFREHADLLDEVARLREALDASARQAWDLQRDIRHLEEP